MTGLYGIIMMKPQLMENQW